MSRRWMHLDMAGMEEGARDSLWQVSLSDSHCGAGCVLGDIAGEWIVWATAWESLPPATPCSPPRSRDG